MATPTWIQNTSDWLKAQDTGSGPINPPLTQTASSHSIVIKTDRGMKIGRIQSWSPTMTRVIDSVFEVQVNATGEPLERVPQIQTTNSISVDRYELYVSHLGEAFGVKLLSGDNDLVSLTLQTNPFHVREIWRDPYGGIRGYLYTNCWFSNLGQTISATDDRVIKARATLEYTRKIRMI